MSLTVDQFAKAVIAAGLSSADEINAIWKTLPSGGRPKDGETLATALVERGKLTRFQARELLSGGATPLVLGDYVLLAKIGAGGMGQVFKAQHQHMKRVVAIKLLPPMLTNDEAAVRRFQREVEAAAKLVHPNIVQAYDASVQRGVWYLVMEYVEGQDLASLLAKSGPVSVELALDYLLQAARGLAFAHSKGVIHRDIKPANLQLDAEGTVKILDMGLARLGGAGDDFATHTELTGAGYMGTVDYMAPEQGLDVRTADARSDIYSLGCTLYRLLTGERIYQRDTMPQTMRAHEEAPIPSFATKLAGGRNNVVVKLDALFQRMVAKLPANRPQTMIDVIRELESLAEEVAQDVPANSPHANSRQPVSGKKSAAQHGSTRRTPVTLQTTEPFAQPVVERTIELPIPAENTTKSNFKPSARPAARQFSKVALSKALGHWPILAGVAAALLLSVVAGGLLVYGRLPESPAPKIVANKPAPKTHTTAPTKETSVPPPKPITPTEDNPTPPRAFAPFNSTSARDYQDQWASHLKTQVVTKNSLEMQMVLIPPGEFLMGSVEIASGIVERPQNPVVITKPFLMAATEVTIGQYRKFIEATKNLTEPQKLEEMTWQAPGFVVTDESPASCVSWNDAVLFCNWLSNQEKRETCYSLDTSSWVLVPETNGYRLPTEAEWEYACRAGTTTAYSFGDEEGELEKYAWYEKNAGKGAHEVGTKLPNPWGLFDMHGNLFEWCHDGYGQQKISTDVSIDPTGPPSYNSDYRVTRGGDWKSPGSFGRNGTMPSYRSYSNGIRPVRGW